MRHTRTIGDRSRGRRLTATRTALIILAGILTIAAVGWLGAGPATGHPGNTCDPEPGHGTPGCHVDATTSTAPAVNAGETSTTQVVPSSGPASPPSDPNAVQMFMDQNNCLSCHGDPSLTGLMTLQRPDGTSVALYVDRSGLSNSVHRYKDCTACHGTDPHDTKSPLTKLSLSEKCGGCHEYEYEQYKQSVHGAGLASGNTDPATCVDCHSETSNPHNIVRVLDASSTIYPKNIADTCAKCHDDPGLMDKYGITEKVYSSYMRSFHGKAMKLSPKSSPIQQLNTATCVSCHGAHNIVTVDDPNARVAGMANLLETCKTCHPDAGPEFVNGFLGHKISSSQTLPQVYWAGRGFYLLTRAMLVGGMLVVGTSISLRGLPWLSRRMRRKKKKDKE